MALGYASRRRMNRSRHTITLTHVERRPEPRRVLGLEPPSREEILARTRSKPGLYASLSPEALDFLRNYDGPENMGPLLSGEERRIVRERTKDRWSRAPGTGPTVRAEP